MNKNKILLVFLILVVFISVSLPAEYDKSEFNVINSFGLFAKNVADIDIGKGTRQLFYTLSNRLNQYTEREKKLISNANKKVYGQRLIGHAFEARLETKSGSGKIEFIFLDKNRYVLLPDLFLKNGKPAVNPSGQKKLVKLIFNGNSFEAKRSHFIGRNKYWSFWNISIYESGNNTDKTDLNLPYVVKLEYFLKKDPFLFAFILKNPTPIKIIDCEKGLNKKDTEILLKRLGITQRELENGFTSYDSLAANRRKSQIKGEFDLEGSIKKLTFIHRGSIIVLTPNHLFFNDKKDLYYPYHILKVDKKNTSNLYVEVSDTEFNFFPN